MGGFNMWKFVFNIIASSLALPCDYLIGLIIMELIGQVAYSYAYYKVGELGLNGEIGSAAHWFIRLCIVYLMWMITSIVIYVVKFITQNWIYFLIALIFCITIIALIIYARNNTDSRLNKNIIKNSSKSRKK